MKKAAVFAMLIFLLLPAAAGSAGDKTSRRTSIRFRDTLRESGIDFVHHAPRPRWCEIGPTVQGIATNEGLDLVLKDDKEFWLSGWSC